MLVANKCLGCGLKFPKDSNCGFTRLLIGAFALEQAAREQEPLRFKFARYFWLLGCLHRKEGWIYPTGALSAFLALRTLDSDSKIERTINAY